VEKFLDMERGPSKYGGLTTKQLENNKKLDITLKEYEEKLSNFI